MSEFVLQVKDIDEGGRDYRFPIELAWMTTALEGCAELRPDATAPAGALHVRATKSGEDVLVDGRVRARYLAECFRCLGDAPIDVDTSFTVLLTARGGALRP